MNLEDDIFEKAGLKREMRGAKGESYFNEEMIPKI